MSAGMTFLFHYTDKDGWNGIRATPDWRFRANKPPGPHPFGAYFTNLDEATPYLAARLCIPRRKLSHFFVFHDIGDLKQLAGGRGRYVPILSRTIASKSGVRAATERHRYDRRY
jgi:hypothetical protein